MFRPSGEEGGFHGLVEKIRQGQRKLQCRGQSHFLHRSAINLRERQGAGVEVVENEEETLNYIYVLKY